MDRAERMAYNCLLRLNVRSLPVQPEALLRLCRGTVLYTFREATETLGLSAAEFERRCGSTDAFTLRADLSDGTTRFIVCFREDGNRARLRFTLAHELGHIVLRHSGGTPSEEQEAERFASYLLCPRPVVQRLLAVDPGMTANRLAPIFYVSERAAQRVLSEPGTFVDQMLSEQVAALFACTQTENIG